MAITTLSVRVISVCLCTLLVTACASTKVTLSPSPQNPVCDRSARALVLWMPKWRPNQKDVLAREQAVASGLARFLASSGCFAYADLRREDNLDSFDVDTKPETTAGDFDLVVTITVRELGPVVKLLSSALLVEGGTEALFQVTSLRLQPNSQTREFTVHWQNGGPGVVKGVASLPNDMSEALRIGLQPSTPIK